MMSKHVCEYSLYRSPNIVRVIKYRRLGWAGHVARIEEVRIAFKILTGKPTGQRPLGRSRRRWEDNIRMNLTEICINTRNLALFGHGSINHGVSHDALTVHI